MNSGKIKKADIILVAVLVILAVITLLISKLLPVKNPTLTVYLSDGSVKYFNLNEITETQDIEIEKNVIIRLENKRACFLFSDCEDKVCVNYGWLEDIGDYAACLPHKVAMAITEGKEGEVDAIV